jgi:hypothetical protein
LAPPFTKTPPPSKNTKTVGVDVIHWHRSSSFAGLIGESGKTLAE